MMFCVGDMSPFERFGRPSSVISLSFYPSCVSPLPTPTFTLIKHGTAQSGDLPPWPSHPHKPTQRTSQAIHPFNFLYAIFIAWNDVFMRLSIFIFSRVGSSYRSM